MKRLVALFAIFGLVEVLFYTNLPASESTVSAQGCIQLTDAGITNDTRTTKTITLPESGCVEYSGMIAATTNMANAGPFFLFEDNAEKIYNLRVERPTVVSISASFDNPKADLDVFLVLPPQDAPERAVETDLLDSGPILGSGFSEEIRPNVLLPDTLYFLAVSNFEYPNSNPPYFSPPTRYRVRFTMGGRPDIHLDAGNAGPGTLGRFTSGNGRLEVNRFSIGPALGISGCVPVEITGIVYQMCVPDVGIRKSPLGDYFNFVAFTAPAGTVRPPDNPPLLTNQRITITKVNSYVQVDLTNPLMVTSDQEFFAGMFLDYRDPGPSNINLSRRLIISWLLQNERTADRTYFTVTTTPGDTPALSGWAVEEFTSTVTGQTGRGPLRFRVIARIPGSNNSILIRPEGATAPGPNITLSSQ
jgi:hypothetical protein